MKDIILIDKPTGITSFDVIRQMRKKLGVRKIGHAGTLDPLATGLLILAVGEGTKKLGQYMGLSKEYEVLVEFGKTSSTYDADGEIVGRRLRAVSRQEFKALLEAGFTGEIAQTPPSFSAIKIKGKRAYELARKGFKFAIPPRPVRVYSIEILEWNWPFVRLRIKCGKGTYIRSLAHDIGEKLGCGGYVKELRRTAIGNFRVEDAVPL